MPTPLLITATDLEHWADRLDSQSYLPKLVRRLIRAITPPNEIRFGEFRSGEGIQLEGWDGITVVDQGRDFVPAGVAAWEMGTNKRPKAKIDDDYSKRSAKPGDIEPGSSTFVFVTPRRWSKKNEWVKAKKDEGVWQDIRVLDADDLEAWLELAPAVHVWISEVIGKPANSVQDLDSFWRQWSESTAPAFTPELVLGGRDEAAERLLDGLMSEQGYASLQGASPEDAVAFLVASILLAPEPERELLLASGLIVDDPATWRYLSRFTEPLLLIPCFDNVDVSGATNHGHRVFVPMARSRRIASGIVELPPISRSVIRDALQSMGVPKERLRDLSLLGHRSLQALRRKMTPLPSLRQPIWAEDENGFDVIPALLAGMWDQGIEGDRRILELLSDCTYDEFIRRVTRWTFEGDPPTYRVGTSWYLVSKEDCWILLNGLLTQGDLGRFREACLEVLATDDPAISLAPDTRHMAGILGKQPPFSGLLTEGLADTLAAIAVLSSETIMPDGRSGRYHVTAIVRDLLAESASDSSGAKWSTIVNVMPLLAEAAPEDVLTALESAVSQDSSSLLRLFREAETGDNFFRQYPYAPVIWTLESLAWSRVLLSRAVLVLAMIARQMGESGAGDHARRSLREIFLLWHPQTSASIDERSEVLDLLRASESSEYWRVVASLIPRLHDHAIPTYRPRWRFYEWVPDNEPKVTYGEVERGARDLGERLIEAANAKANRWIRLLRDLSNLPVPIQDNAIERLQSIGPSMSDPDQVAIWHEIRAVISSNRRYPKANWAMAPDRVNSLQEVYVALTPEDLVQQFVWLFSDSPSLISASDYGWESYQHELEQLRDDAVINVFGKHGLDGVLHLVRLGDNPFSVGVSLGRQSNDYVSVAEEVLMFLASVEDSLRDFSRGYVVQQFRQGSWEWVDTAISQLGELRNPNQIAEFLTCLPLEARVWDFLDQYGDDVAQAYWARYRPSAYRDAGDSIRAAQELIRYERPFVAAELLSHMIAWSCNPPPELVIQALELTTQVPSSEEDPYQSTFRHNVGELLNYLDELDGVESSTLARLEWLYLPLLRHGYRSTLTLHKALAQDASFFVQLIALLYPATSDDAPEPTDDVIAQARRVRELLDEWRTVPGARDDGGLDADTLKDWVVVARQLLSEKGRIAAGDEHIGRILRYAPVGSDTVWPHPVVRDLIEQLRSSDLESGIEVEVLFRRGVISRGLLDGGTQERALAEQYYAWADQLALKWPHTAAMLRRIEKTFADLAREEDLRARQTEESI